MKKESWSDLMVIISILALIMGIVVLMGVNLSLNFSQWVGVAVLLMLYGIYFKMKD